MKQLKYLSVFVATLALLFSLGCASTSTQESTGQYVDDSAITAKVKSAIFNEPSLSSAEINVETYKNIVQLSGFVSSQADINTAANVASNIVGVQSVKNDMRVK
jgi:hyperosmotically inducible protein